MNQTLSSIPEKEITIEDAYTSVAEALGIHPESVREMHRYYLAMRNHDQTTRTQKIIYDALASVRAREKEFPYQLKNAYIISTAFSRAGLTEKKSPNPYISKASGKRKLTPAEVVDLIEARQDALLEQVKIHGMSEGYSSFARAVNAELATTGANHEVPLDWKFLSKRLGDGNGKNLHTGGGFQALRLSHSVRYEMTRVLQGRPLYPGVSVIRRNQTFKKFLGYYLEEFQQNEEKGGFHRALAQFISEWNQDESYGKKYFLLPVALFPSDHQENLADLLGIEEYGVRDFLEALGLPVSVWHFGYDAHKLSVKAGGLLLPHLREAINRDITSEDFTINKGIVRWSVRALERYKRTKDLTLAQDIYEASVLPLMEEYIEGERERR